jgi:hypothetical protein
MTPTILQYFEASPFFAGIMMLVLNIGSRFITHEYSDNDEEYRQNILLRRLAIFAACFIGTRSVVVSIILTAAFVVLSAGLFRGKSEYAKEGMNNVGASQMTAMRAAAGLMGEVDEPGYDKKTPPMF